jgi:hypothetical protein
MNRSTLNRATFDGRRRTAAAVAPVPRTGFLALAMADTGRLAVVDPGIGHLAFVSAGADGSLRTGRLQVVEP